MNRKFIIDDKISGGFTILEMIIVIGILGIIAAMGQSGYGVWQKQVQINTVNDQIRSSLIRVQQEAVAAPGGKAMGMHLEADRYVIFSGTVYDPADTANNVKILSGIIIVNPSGSLSDGSLGFSPDVVFDKFDGRTVNTGTITVAVASSPSVTRSVTVGRFGSIE